jgi:hypothetical protein
MVVAIRLKYARQSFGEVSSTQSITPFPQNYMLHWEILLLTDRGIPIGHLEKKMRARVNNHFKTEFKSKSRDEKWIEEQGSKCFFCK